MVLAAVGQFCATSSLINNANIIKELILQASKAGASVLFLPEASDYIASSPDQSLTLAKPVESSNAIQDGVVAALKSIPMGQVKPYVSIGVHEPTSGTRVKNTLLWFSPDGELLNRYQKLHLFDVEITNGPILKESNGVEPGNKLIEPFDSPIGKIGPAICYDIRFPEMALRLRRLGAQILQYPSAFTVKTGMAHWEVLARARAIDTQSYVMMPALIGVHDFPVGKRQSYGHALIVDPWGTVLAEAASFDTNPRIITADIDLAMLDKSEYIWNDWIFDVNMNANKTIIVREDMPLWEQRRTDVFGEI